MHAAGRVSRQISLELGEEVPGNYPAIQLVEVLMKHKWISLILVLLAVLAPIPARADGIIIPQPPVCDSCPPPPCLRPGPCPTPSPMTQLDIRYHQVQVTIQDQLAVTHVDQVFYNPNDWTVEGTYLFPLPADAAVSSFTLWVDGQPVQGQVLDAEQARQQYQQIVSSLRDPALLEYAGRGAVQAHIFPIPPHGERRIELQYNQALTAENGLVRYVYPLNTEKFSRQPLEKVSINVDIRSTTPIRAVYSPSHEIAVDRQGDQHVIAGYEAQNVLPDNDFALYYSLGETQALHLLSYRDPSDAQDADGFFMLLLAPQPDVSPTSIPKDVILVLDHSGSMDGEKFSQAQEALRYILQNLNSEDRFNVIAFSTGLETYAGQLRPATQAADAIRWVNGLSALGSTDINRALLEAASLADSERPTYLIFLTDGLPTEGVVDSQQILDNFQGAAPHNLRLFAFGVGYDVDTFLLDSLSQAHHGSSTYVLPGQRLDEILSAFYARISTPVLTDLQLDFGGISTYDLYPSPLPDLFRGSQIVLVGRYRQGGSATLRLSGTVNGQPQTFEFPDQQFAASLEHLSPGEREVLASLPRLWATRKIGYLLNQVRLNGADQEIIDQIVKLSIRYGIVTPYTSYLVTEPMPLGVEQQDRIANDAFSQMQAMATAPASGQAAVERAAAQGSLAEAEAPAPLEAGTSGQVRIVGAQTFVLQDGVWVDTSYDPQRMEAVKVAFLSEDYFALLQARPDLAGAFALGQQVIALSGGVAYQVVDDGQSVPPLQIPTTLTPQTTPTSQPAAQATPTGESPPTDPPTNRGVSCLGGLLPLMGLALALTWVRRMR
jgi:Ca-activated chloride channel family protein